jgi:hypothetical protein
MTTTRHACWDAAACQETKSPANLPGSPTAAQGHVQQQKQQQHSPCLGFKLLQQLQSFIDNCVALVPQASLLAGCCDCPQLFSSPLCGIDAHKVLTHVHACHPVPCCSSLGPLSSSSSGSGIKTKTPSAAGSGTISSKARLRVVQKVPCAEADVRPSFTNRHQHVQVYAETNS